MPTTLGNVFIFEQTVHLRSAIVLWEHARRLLALLCRGWTAYRAGSKLRQVIIRQIMIEAETADDPQSMFSVSVDAGLISRGITGEQAHLLVGEILGAQENYAEMVNLDVEVGGRASYGQEAFNAKARAHHAQAAQQSLTEPSVASEAT